MSVPVSREKMPSHVQKMRDFYDRKPGAPLYRTEFGYYCIEAWEQQGLPKNAPWAQLAELFQYDKGATHGLGGLGWCEAELVPAFDEKIVEDRGEHEIVQDYAGRHVLYFKGRRNGFMPEYVDHPVKDLKTWNENVKWRLDPKTPQRYATLDERMKRAQAAAAEGQMIVCGLIGGYMYLRSLMGPEALLYMFYDQPALIHDCMQTWLALADAVTARHQQHVTIDEVFLAEDICYNHGCLISPDMMREFLLPYYQQFISNLKLRQIDKSRHVFVQVDTDGFADPVIPIYRESIGMDYMSPFEVASGCDVVAIGQRYPDLLIRGGIDKRVLAESKNAIDEMVERILPAMRKRGGYIPCCDHGVPAEVPLENYFHYRKRCVELGG
ncbi:MAG TPA: uroporphyrinogen decarboxylase family protein [Planctomycetota bacterium]|jgi:uroporphyrinogen decarboxylase